MPYVRYNAACGSFMGRLSRHSDLFFFLFFSRTFCFFDLSCLFVFFLFFFFFFFFFKKKSCFGLPAISSVYLSIAKRFFNFFGCFTMISFGSCSSFNSGSASSSRVLILLIVNVFGMFLSSTHATCYLPNGTDINLGYRSSPYIPCKSSSISEHSMCCWAGMDKCLSNGLCYYAGHTYRAACTDPTWKSSSCVKLCSSGSGIFFFSRGARS